MFQSGIQSPPVDIGFTEKKTMLVKILDALNDDSFGTKAHLQAMTALKIIR